MAALLPDLQVLKGKYGRTKFLTNVRVGRDEEGHRVLRFSNAIANYGKGPLEVRGDLGAARIVRGVRTVPAYQYILQTDGQFRRRRIKSFGYDPDPDHAHWHYSGFAEYRLKRGGNVVVRSRKQAFCLVDIRHVRPDIPGSPSPREYPESGCERRTGTLRMGISIGWADVYYHYLHGQFIDIDAVPAGIYWLESEVNPDKSLLVRHTGGNVARVKIRLDSVGQTVKVRVLPG